MDNRPIGIFDSGVGGLTCIPYLMRQLPKERIIYFGDTARTPYGSKAPETVKYFSKQIAEFLAKNDVKMIVIACNTVTAICLEELKVEFPDIPIVGIIEPTAQVIADICSARSRVGVIGTKITVTSGAYKKEINKKSNKIKVFERACPAFVPLIEEGIIQHDIMDLTIQYYMDDFILENRLDTIILGCTHYPLLKSNIKRMYPNLKIVNPSKEVVTRVVEILKENDSFAKIPIGENRFYASDLSKNFLNMIKKICDDANFKIELKKFDL